MFADVGERSASPRRRLDRETDVRPADANSGTPDCPRFQMAARASGLPPDGGEIEMSTAITHQDTTEDWAGSHWRLERAESVAEFRVKHF